ncbi:unnamed protein product [Adineta ricciae]|uniref:ADP ribosyltransferase domain-containing protein n=2 Tax=Adineta ricciae TaxID=249248 RepID=A0A814AIK6_ADIRI|nr:unnamed protein product [Adineta ricciae]
MDPILQNDTNRVESMTSPVELPTQRLMDLQSTPFNRHDVCVLWLDPKIDSTNERTQKFLNQLCDRVEIHNDIGRFLEIIRYRRETSLLIISGKFAAQYLDLIHSFSAIDAVIIFCASPEKYQDLTQGAYVKVLSCIATEPELIQSVHSWINLKCQTHLYIWDNQVTDTEYRLTQQRAIFLANYILMSTVYLDAYTNYKQNMLNVSRAYYGQRQCELEHILQFELTYTETDAIKWYTRDSFVHKLVNRTLRSFDQNNLHAIAFYIRDLIKQISQIHSTTDTKNFQPVYHGLAMTQNDINRIEVIPTGSLLSSNGFLSTSRSQDVAIAFASKKQNSVRQPLHRVLFEINLNVTKSPVVFADISHLSTFPEEGEVLFSTGAVFSLQNITQDEQTKMYTICLNIATQDEYNSIEKFVASAKEQLNERTNTFGQKSLIGKLLNFQTQPSSPLKTHGDASYKFSIFGSSFNHIWYGTYDKYNDILEPYIQKIASLAKKYIFENTDKVKKHTGKKAIKHSTSYEPSLARFEPVLYFSLPDELIQQEQENFSRIFSLQYRRFTNTCLTVAQASALLDEFYLIYYIASDLPEYIKDCPRVKFYKFDPSEDNQISNQKVKLFERLISDMLHDLGMFYPKQIKTFPDDVQYQTIIRRLHMKTARCYQALADETEKIIQRYNREEEEEKKKRITIDD